MQGFFSVPKPLIIFLGIKKSNADRVNVCRRNKAGRQMEHSLSSIYFLDAQKADASEKCREIPGGGGGH
jgi:hypothetical protein